MSAGARESLPGEKTDPNGDPLNQNANRFLIASVAFVIYESVLIIVFGDYFYAGVSSELGSWAMVGAAALGYLLLGALAGSPASLLIAALPVLIAWAADSPVPAEAWGGENLPLYLQWMVLIYIFLPAWVLGLLGGRLIEARRNGGMRKR